MRPPIDVLTRLFEGAPRFVARMSDESIAGLDELIDRALELAAEMTEDELIELIDGHPRIGADPASVSAPSFREQGYNRDSGSALLQARLDRLNDEYERRFGFRCVVFVNGRSRAVIADWMATRLDAEREVELRRAVADVFAIARDRLARLTQPQEELR